MGLQDMIRNQLVDIIEFSDDNNKLIVVKYDKNGDEIRQGANLIVRESQAAIFLKQGKLADVFLAGNYKLNTENVPILSSLDAWSSGFNSALKSDLYFVSLKQFTDNKWGTRNPILLRDEEFGVVRLRGFGSFSFAIVDPKAFMTEFIGTQHLVTTYDIIEYLTSIAIESIAVCIANTNLPALDLVVKYREIGDDCIEHINKQMLPLGVEFKNVIIENLSLPDELEKLIDEQSSINMASKNMQGYTQWHSARAMRDAARQSGGFAGIGAGFAFGGQMAETITTTQAAQPTQIIKVKCPSCGGLNDEAAKFCCECGESLVKKKACPTCGADVSNEMKFCIECGTKLK